MSSSHIPGPLPYTLYYIFVFAFQAAIMTFFPLHCAALGFSVLQISLISAGENLATLLGPPLLMRWRLQLPGFSNLFVSYAIISVILFLPLLIFESFAAVALWWLAALLFNRALLAMVNHNAVHSLSADRFHFGRVRVWGSLGFIGALYLLGYLIQWQSASITVPVCIMFLVTLIPICRKFCDLDDFQEPEVLGGGKTGRTAKLFLFSVALNWAAHGALYAYFSLHLEKLGWSALEISSACALGVLAEVILFVVFHHWEKRSTLLTIWRISTLIAAVRFVLLGMTDNTVAIYLLQILHAFSFGSCYLASTKVISSLLPPAKRPFAQAMLVSYGIGLGTLVGKLIAGVQAKYFVLQLGYGPLFITSGLLALVGYLVAFRLGEVKTSGRGKNEEGIDPSVGGEAC